MATKVRLKMAKPRHKKPRRTARNRQPASPERIDVDKRRAQMLDLRIEGYSLRAIGEKLGMHHSSVAEAIESELAELTREPAERLRTVELERMDAMLVGLWPKAKTGDVASVQAALGVMARRAKLLGLDAPVKTENKHGGSDDGKPIRVAVTPEQALAELREELEDNPELLKKLVGQ